MEERNEIAVFSRPEAQGLPETTEFFASLRATYLQRAKKRAKKATIVSQQSPSSLVVDRNQTHESNTDVNISAQTSSNSNENNDS